MVFEGDISKKAVGFGISKKKSDPHCQNMWVDLDLTSKFQTQFLG